MRLPASMVSVQAIAIINPAAQIKNWRTANSYPRNVRSAIKKMLRRWSKKVSTTVTAAAIAKSPACMKATHLKAINGRYLRENKVKSKCEESWHLFRDV